MRTLLVVLAGLLLAGCSRRPAEPAPAAARLDMVKFSDFAAASNYAAWCERSWRRSEHESDSLRAVTSRLRLERSALRSLLKITSQDDAARADSILSSWADQLQGKPLLDPMSGAVMAFVWNGDTLAVTGGKPQLGPDPATRWFEPEQAVIGTDSVTIYELNR